MRAATMRSPACSKRARILPIAFFFTASGLMMDKVRSCAIPQSPWRPKNQLAILARRHGDLRKNKGLGDLPPLGHQALRAARRLPCRRHAEARHPDELVVAIQQRQPLAPPRRNARLLEEI